MQSPRENSTLLSITMRVRTSDGTERTIEVDPTKGDALFWSEDAVDRFLVPAYGSRERLGAETEPEARVFDESGLIIVVPIVHKRSCKIWLPFFELGDPGPIRMR
jgi:hypothetical protein